MTTFSAFFTRAFSCQRWKLSKNKHNITNRFFRLLIKFISGSYLHVIHVHPNAVRSHEPVIKSCCRRSLLPSSVRAKLKMDSYNFCALLHSSLAEYCDSLEQPNSAEVTPCMMVKLRNPTSYRIDYIRLFERYLVRNERIDWVSFYVQTLEQHNNTGKADQQTSVYQTFCVCFQQRIQPAPTAPVPVNGSCSLVAIHIRRCLFVARRIWPHICWSSFSITCVLGNLSECPFYHTFQLHVECISFVPLLLIFFVNNVLSYR